jgi:tRNA(Ile)-lysidine synthase
MPITLSDFKDHLGDVTFPLAVAVSGGADSLALLLLAHEVAQERGSHVIALTVNHNLRAEAADEALQVKKWANARGIEHRVLRWEHDHPTARLQEKARQARYDLITKWCKDHQISTVLLGHHQQDQEETFWLRLASGSGLDGLAGMKKCVAKEGILFMRPFLNIPKERIQETLWAQNQDWIEDPSNQSPRFFRGRLRQFLQEEGLSSSRLHNVMTKLRRDADFIQDSLRQGVETTVHLHEGGYLSLNKEKLQTLHTALAERLLSFVAQWYSGAFYPPRTAQISAVMDKINQGRPFTMGGVYWVILPQDIVLFRERRAVKDVLSLDQLHEPTLWDHRFLVDPGIKNYFPSGTTIQALGDLEHAVHPSTSAPFRDPRSGRTEKGRLLHTVRPERSCEAAKPKDRMVGTIPKRAWPTLPALWVKGKVVAVPRLCYPTEKSEEDLQKLISLKPLFHDSLRFIV